MFKRPLALVACFVAAAMWAAVGQEPAKLRWRYRIEKITNDKLILRISDNWPAKGIIVQTPDRLETFKVGSILPAQDWVITSLGAWTKKVNGITRWQGEIGLRDCHTGQKFTYNPEIGFTPRPK